MMKNVSNQTNFSVTTFFKKAYGDSVIRGASSAFTLQIIGAGLGYLSQIILARFRRKTTDYIPMCWHGELFFLIFLSLDFQHPY